MTTQTAPAAERTEVWTRERVLGLSREELIALWSEAPAVDMVELNGEYEGLVPNAGDPEAEARVAEVMYNEDSEIGYWLGKAYLPLTETTGDGYNRWRRPGGKVERNIRFGTAMGPSLIDGKPALLMYYGAYVRADGSQPRSTLVDEIRKLADGVYLGMGTVEEADGSRSQPGHFAMVGPVGEWVGVDDPDAEVE